jgi:chemotaxis-related protein WspB
MLALAFRAGDAELAVAARDIVEVLPRMPMRTAPLAPPGVVGLLPYRGMLTPVVDLCLIVAGRPAEALLGTRIIVVSVGSGDSQRWLGLLAEDVVDLVEIGDTLEGLGLPEAPWLGRHLTGGAGLPQLVDPAELLPEALLRLFVPEGTA